MHKEGLETYNESIKILILLLCISIRQDKDIEITISTIPCNCTNQYICYFNNFLQCIESNIC